MWGLQPMSDALTGAAITGALTASGLTLRDDKFSLTGSVDATKIGRFELDGNTTGTTRVYTLPNLDTTLAGLAVAQTFTAAQTISNATASTNTATGSLINGGGFGNAGAAWIGGFVYTGKSGSGTGGNVRFVHDGGTAQWLAGILGGAGDRAYSLYNLVAGREDISVSASTGAVTLGAGGLVVTGAATISNATASTSIGTGSLINAGGFGNAGAAWIGGLLNVAGTLTASGRAKTSGYFVISGTLAGFDAASGGLYGYYSSGGVLASYGDNAGTLSALTIDGSTIALRPGGVTALALTAGGRTLLGAPTDDGATRLQVNGAVSATGNITQTGATTLSTGTGAITLNGAVGIVAGKALTVNDTTASTSATTGALIVTGGAGIGGAANIGGALKAATTITVGGVALSSDVAGILGIPYLAITADVNGSVAQATIGYGNLSSGTGTYILKTRSAADTTADTIVQNGDQLGKFIWMGADGASYRNAAMILASVDGVPGASDMPGRLEFHVTPDGSATMVEALRISNTGAVNIYGTTDGILNVAGKITAKAAVPGSFASLAAVQTYLASILT